MAPYPPPPPLSPGSIQYSSRARKRANAKRLYRRYCISVPTYSYMQTFRAYGAEYLVTWPLIVRGIQRNAYPVKFNYYIFGLTHPGYFDFLIICSRTNEYSYKRCVFLTLKRKHNVHTFLRVLCPKKNLSTFRPSET